MPWIEFHIGNGSLLLFRLTEVSGAGATGAGETDIGAGAPTHMPWVFVDDLDAHFAQATAAGAQIVEPIHQHGYRAYVADDLEGHRWTFAQARPTMAP